MFRATFRNIKNIFKISIQISLKPSNQKTQISKNLYHAFRHYCILDLKILTNSVIEEGRSGLEILTVCKGLLSYEGTDFENCKAFEFWDLERETEFYTPPMLRGAESQICNSVASCSRH